MYIFLSARSIDQILNMTTETWRISERRDRTRTSQYDFSEQDYYIGNHNARRTFSCNGNSFTSHTRLVGILILLNNVSELTCLAIISRQTTLKFSSCDSSCSTDCRTSYCHEIQDKILGVSGVL